MIYKFYENIYNKNYNFLNTHQKFKRLLILLNYILTTFIFCSYTLLCICGIFTSIHEKSWEIIIRVVLVPLLCLMAVTALRRLINRKRPFQCCNIIPIIKNKKPGNSFPSRHIASAVVIGMIFIPHCLTLSILIFISAVILSYIRFALGIHYPTDLLSGGIIGIIFGLISLI